jgi:hypothetical protein
MRQSYKNWGCPEQLLNKLTRTEVALSICEVIFQNWGCSMSTCETNLPGGCSKHLWAKFTRTEVALSNCEAIFQNWGCSEHLWDNLSRSETILPELRLLWAAVRPSSLSPVSFMLFWRLADRVRARASSTVLNKICLPWHCLKYVSQPKVKISFPGIEKISWCYNYTYYRTMTIVEEPWG